MLRAVLVRQRAVSGLSEQDGGLVSLEEIEHQRQRISTNTWAVVMFIAYLILGLLVNCFGEEMNALDSVYLSIITLTTIGYGDVRVQNRTFQIFYVLLGCGLVGIYFGMFTNDVMESQEAALSSRLVSAASLMEKRAEEAFNKAQEFQREQHNKFLARIEGIPIEELSPVDQMRLSLSKVFLENQEKEHLRRLKAINLQVYDDELRELRSKGLVDIFFVVVALFSGATCMVYIEGWTFRDAFYWACVTTMTVGYGDVTPTSEVGKVFTIIYVLFSTVLAAKGFRDVVCYPMIVRGKENEAYILSQFSDNLSAKMLNKIIHNNLFSQIERLQYNPEQITKAEFVMLVLFSMNKVNMKDISLAAKCFDRLDVHHAGALGRRAQHEQMQKAIERDRQRVLEMSRLEEEEQARQAQRAANNIFSKATGAVMSLGTVMGSAAARVVRSRGHSVSSLTSYVNLQDEEEGEGMGGGEGTSVGGGGDRRSSGSDLGHSRDSQDDPRRRTESTRTHRSRSRRHTPMSPNSRARPTNSPPPPPPLSSPTYSPHLEGGSRSRKSSSIDSTESVRGEDQDEETTTPPRPPPPPSPDVPTESEWLHLTSGVDV